MKKSSSKNYSEASRELSRSNALEQGKVRHQAVVDAVSAAMRAIEAEIRANNGTYPGNGGALGFNELMRRSQVGLKTLFGPKYKDSFKAKIVDPWLQKTTTAEVASRQAVKSSAIRRVADWRELYNALLDSHRKSELDLQEAQRQLENAKRQIEVLTRENARLGAALRNERGASVVQFRKFEAGASPR